MMPQHVQWRSARGISGSSIPERYYRAAPHSPSPKKSRSRQYYVDERYSKSYADRQYYSPKVATKKSRERSLPPQNYSPKSEFPGTRRKLKEHSQYSDYEERKSPVKKMKSSYMARPLANITNIKNVSSKRRHSPEFYSVCKPQSPRSPDYPFQPKMYRTAKTEKKDANAKKDSSDEPEEEDEEEDGEIRDDESTKDYDAVSNDPKEDCKENGKQELEEGELIGDQKESEDGLTNGNGNDGKDGSNMRISIRDKSESLSPEKTLVIDEEDKESVLTISSSDSVDSQSNRQQNAEFSCPHCRFECDDFIEYTQHLSLKQHLKTMRILSNKQILKLKRLRAEQREKQRSIESKMKNLPMIALYCVICKLHYRTSKSHHVTSADHMEMKEFVQPYCSPCKTSFKSPWAYQSHLCNPYHLKNEKRIEQEQIEPTKENDIIDMLDTDYMVLDEVGSSDEDIVSSGEKSENENTKVDTKEEVKSPDRESQAVSDEEKEEIKIGAEHCLLVEVYYCSLCKSYLSRDEDTQIALKLHCRTRHHIQKYVNHCEKIKKEKANTEETDKLESNSQKEENFKEEKADEDWSELDKDLTVLLQDTEEENGEIKENDKSQKEE